MFQIICLILLAACLWYLYDITIGSLRKKSKFKKKLGAVYSGDAAAMRELGRDFSYGNVPSKIYGYQKNSDSMARKYILYALAEKIDGKEAYLDGEAKNGNYEVVDSINLAREFVEACYDKYGDKGAEKVIDTVVAKNFNLG